ncbi:hypothetical protein [Pedobacter metabolipauper]|uniref:SH3 domain-containing protein n=1 Tax=Pedobacter metabolipauper TaxID=425513 RepID=A0A4V3D1B7_9SPHI|nr:hypothetical protein [Pedobacter metabolipauper]TDQ10027.1 hypothetical protein ATK78_2186 [Pedobacter metabolipauper]
MKRLPITCAQNGILRTISCLIFLIILNAPAFSQNGTYEKKGPAGSYCVISVENNNNHIKAAVFAWWNTHNGQMGFYEGTGTMKNNSCVLQSADSDPECKVTLNVVQGKLKASFEHCMTDHLTDDFNGVYTKITDAVAGDYIVTVPKAYFYKTPGAGSVLKTYVLKGDKVTLDMDRIAASKQTWLYVYYTNKAGKETAGYISMSALKRIK